MDPISAPSKLFNCSATPFAFILITLLNLSRSSKEDCPRFAWRCSREPRSSFKMAFAVEMLRGSAKSQLHCMTLETGHLHEIVSHLRIYELKIFASSQRTMSKLNLHRLNYSRHLILLLLLSEMLIEFPQSVMEALLPLTLTVAIGLRFLGRAQIFVNLSTLSSRHVPSACIIAF